MPCTPPQKRSDRAARRRRCRGEAFLPLQTAGRVMPPGEAYWPLVTHFAHGFCGRPTLGHRFSGSRIPMIQSSFWVGAQPKGLRSELHW